MSAHPAPSSPTRRVLLLGGTGTIGRATADALLRRGHEVVCFLRPPAGSDPRRGLPEAAALLDADEPEDMAAAAELAGALKALGPASVLLKGGHADGPDSADIYVDGERQETFRARRIATKNTHGTGCTLSAAIAALLPRMSRVEAIAGAKTYLTGALAAADRLDVGGGHGPLHHFHHVWPAD